MQDWWLRTLLVLQAPGPVFVALRDDRSESAQERAEPVLLIVLLTGIALALASHAAAGYRGLDLAVWLFLAGGITGIAAYWFFGAILFGVARWLGSQGSYRRARHVLAFACVPIALSLVASPLGHRLYAWVCLGFVAWAVGLLVVGVRAVHGWSWQRAATAAVVPVAVGAGLLAL
jgi:hypothetical protein